MTAFEFAAIVDPFVVNAGDILSFFLGGMTGIAFVISSAIRW